jgi:predicted transposase YdaD
MRGEILIETRLAARRKCVAKQIHQLVIFYCSILSHSTEARMLAVFRLSGEVRYLVCWLHEMNELTMYFRQLRLVNRGGLPKFD